MSFKVRQRTPQEPSGSLLVGWPKGFDEAGRHVLNDVGEFMLVEKW
jgi:hypothetical protein